MTEIFMPNWLEFLIAALATIVHSAAIWYGKEFAWLRERAGVYYLDSEGKSVTFWGRQLQCFWCVSFWVSLPVSLFAWLWPVILIPPALSGAAILLSGGGRTIWREAIR